MRRNILLWIISLLLLSLLGALPSYANLNYSYVKTSFSRLPNWANDNHVQALRTFKASCVEILRRPTRTRFGPRAECRNTRDWQRICVALNNMKNMNDANAKAFFENYFQPFYVRNNVNKNSLFTGYYLPTLKGSLKKSAHYNTPIYGIPSDLVRLNLGLFHPRWSGKYITGRWHNNSLKPYPSRTAIVNGVIHDKTKVLAWSNSIVDVFFAQIQGSALVELDNKKSFLIGYAANNGHAYTSIGKVLVERGSLSKENVSMASIRKWLDQHPDQLHQLLNKNASFVFFRMLSTPAPLGTEQVPLTPYRSLAVDTRVIPLGAPVWLDTRVPKLENKKQVLTYRHLMVAQDTGGAIKGIRRGDVYWGTGDRAAFYAGHMQSEGEYWVLLPR